LRDCENIKLWQEEQSRLAQEKNAETRQKIEASEKMITATLEERGIKFRNDYDSAHFQFADGSKLVIKGSIRSVNFHQPKDS